MPIPVITNFIINDSVPFDTRLVATSSTAMNGMLFPYEGLTIYRTDTKQNYTYDGSNWAVSSNGIYGGSGALSAANTVASFGTVSTNLGDYSNGLTFRAFSTSSILVDLKNEFIRNIAAGSNTTIRYQSQLRFSEDGGSSFVNGPFIRYNPQTNYVGGISFGTYDTTTSTAYERMIIEGGNQGLISFYVDAAPNTNSKPINIGRNLAANTPFIGYNWNGDDYEGTASCYIEFNNDELTLYSIDGSQPSAYKKTAVFEYGGISFTNNFNLTGNFNFSGNLNGIGASFIIGKGVNGFNFTTTNVNFQFGGVNVGSFNQNIFYIQKDFSIQYQTNTVAPNSLSVPKFSLGARGLIIDNKFNPGANITTENDLVFQRYVSNRISTTSAIPANQITIIPPSSAYRSDGIAPQDYRFRIAALSYNSNLASQVDNGPAYAEYILNTKNYDRIISFYSDSMTFHISHRFSWYLGVLTPIDIENEEFYPSNWKKMGVSETGNTDGWNDSYQLTDAGGYPTDQNNGGVPKFIQDYQIRTYSGNVIVPANSFLKVRFDFPYTWNSTIITTLKAKYPSNYLAYCMSTVFISQRIGNYQTTNGESYPRNSDNGVFTSTGFYGSGSDKQWPYERFTSTNSPSQTWGKTS